MKPLALSLLRALIWGFIINAYMIATSIPFWPGLGLTILAPVLDTLIMLAIPRPKKPATNPKK